MTKSIELKNIELYELSNEEAKDTNGGIIWLLIGSAVGAAIIASAGAAVYASFEAGYNQACN